MTWAVAAVVVAFVHAAYLVYQTFGALLGLRDRRWLLPHLAAVTWGVGIIVVQGRCPATLLEKGLIARSGRPAYTGSFLDHYVFGSLLPDGTQSAVYGLHLVVILLTYVFVLRRWHHRAPGNVARPVDATVE